MPVLSQPSFAAKTALWYITGGAVLDIFATTYWFFFVRPLPTDDPGMNTTHFWVVSIFLLGLVLMVIGFFLGRIGRAARHAELPPPEAMNTEKLVEQQAASNPAGVNPALAGQPMMQGAYPVAAQPMAPVARPVPPVAPVGAASQPPRTA
jgi:hypothetical protein